ncbi:MAG: class I SAM-dependent methyltransferase [Candidatus Woesearchaeota archaeon]
MNNTYYNSIAKGYDELHGEEQLEKLELIGKEINNDSKLHDFIKPNYTLLDVGCGTGISTGFFKVKEKIGIDPSSELIKIAIKNNPLIKFKIFGAEKLVFKNNQFDIVISLTAIQNFIDIEKGLDEINRVGKKYFVLTFLKKSSKHNLIEESIQKKFYVVKQIEQDKDMIYFCKKK